MPFKDPEARRLYLKEYRQRPEVKAYHRRYGRAYHRPHPESKEKQRQRSKNYRQRHLLEVREKDHLRRQCPAAKARIREYNKEYFQSHREELLAQHREYIRLHQENVKKKLRGYYQSHKEVVKERMKKYRQCPQYRTRKREYANEYYKCPESREKIRKYRRSLGGKLVAARHSARRRSRGFTPLCPNPWSCPMDFHHVSPSSSYVIPLPRVVHRAVAGASKYHFVFNASMIVLLYGLNLEILGGL